MQPVPWLLRLPPGVVASCVALLVIATLAIAREFGRRAARQGRNGDLGQFENMASGLLGLLLAFNFSIAQTRFETRQQLLVREANTIGTAYLRCSTLSDEDRAFCRERFRTYLDLRIKGYEAYIGPYDEPKVTRYLAESDRIQGELWTRVARAVRTAPTPGNTWLMLAINQVIDTDADRRAAFRNSVPQPVTLAIVIACVAWASLLGYAAGAKPAGPTWAGIMAALLIGVILGVALDFDRPQSGLIRMSAAERAMFNLRHSMEVPPAD